MDGFVFSVEAWESRPTEDALQAQLESAHLWIEGLTKLVDKLGEENNQLRAEAELGNIPYRDAVELKKRVGELTLKNAMLEQVSAETCEECGWAMQFPGEECRNCGYYRLQNRVEELEGQLRGIMKVAQSARDALVLWQELIDTTGGVYELLLEQHHSWESWEEMPDLHSIINAITQCKEVPAPPAKEDGE
jgi:ribosomal protein L32